MLPQVNEGVREKENSDRLEWIQNHVQCDGVSEVSHSTAHALSEPLDSHPSRLETSSDYPYPDL